MSRDDDLKILNCIYQNSRMAADCIDKVCNKCPDDKLREYIRKQRVHYGNNCDKIAKQIREMGTEPVQPPKVDQFMADMGIDMKTMFDESRTNIAKIMYNGTNMGIIDIAETVNHATEAEDKIVSQAKQLLSAEERYADGLKRFL